MRALDKEPLSNVHWVYFDLPRWMRFWKKGQRGLHLYYYLWQIGAYLIALRLHSKVHFDLAQHVTFGTCWFPSLISLLPLPFVWGPVGGVEPYPTAFLGDLRLRNKLYENWRNPAKIWGNLDPLVFLTAKQAAVILAQTTNSVKYLPKTCRAKAIVFPATGIEHVDFGRKETNRGSETGLRVISVGRLLYIKGFDLGLRAFAKFSQAVPGSEYAIIGDGPEKQRLMRLAFELGVSDKVRFYGFLPRDKVLKDIKEWHVLLHPSLRDPPVHVVIEAMTSGLPVICVDLGGPALQVTEESGIKVPAITPEQVVNDLAKAMLRLAQDPDLRARMGEAARKRVMEQFDWDKKGELIQRLYEEVILKG